MLQWYSMRLQNPSYSICTYKYQQCGREEIPKLKVSWLPRAYDAIASGCIERDSSSKSMISHHETMFIPQCNFSEGNQSSASSKAIEW
jgi:hypothetical protein